MRAKPLILIVDDEPFNVDYLEQELADLDYETVSAGNGQAALDQVAAHGPDMILLDIMMPVMDGFEAIEKIREQGRFQELPIIALTAKAMPEDRAKCLEKGANDYLPKPVEVDMLLTLMRVLLLEEK